MKDPEGIKHFVRQISNLNPDEYLKSLMNS